jgi:soluble lytic murein transglycosylase-like protein
MPDAKAAGGERVPCLIHQEGPLAGTRYELAIPITRIGRAAENDVVIAGVDGLVVSGRHAEIRKEGGQWRIYDLESTNGTFVNGERITEAAIEEPSTIQLGKGGPELRFTASGPAVTAGDPGRTIVAIPDPGAPDGGLATAHERLLRQAVARARHAREAGILNQTGLIMREALALALDRSSRKFKWTIAGLVALLVVVSSYAGFRIYRLQQSKASIDSRIAALEQKLAASAQNPEQEAQLASELDQYQKEGLALRQDVFYRFGVREREDFLAREIQTLLAEFGAEVYIVPPEFRDAVQSYLKQYQGPDRPNMARALGEARPEIERIRGVFSESHLPPDFAYMVLVESALEPGQKSSAGCTGLWQFAPATARALGLRVFDHVDERLNAVKSTVAACKYIRNLILDFGAGSSVMLALAAYNLGPSKVKQAIQRVTDPIKQRNFWYLYRVGALPAETREYVPKVIAAMIIGRHPPRYGF